MPGGCTRVAAVALLLVLTFGLVAAANVAAAPTPPLPASTAHAPILIQGNAGFTSPNGVVSGSGTANKPYLIQGWSIDASGANGIDIRDTTAYFVVDQVSVCCGGSKYLGIAFENVSHGTVRDSDVSSSLVGLRSGDSSHVTVLNGNFSGSQDGMDLWYTNYANVSGANLTGSSGYGLWVNVGYSIDLWYDSVASSQSVGLFLAASSYVRVGQGRFIGQGDAVRNPDLVMTALFAGNYIQSFGASALSLDSGSYLTIRDNVLAPTYGYSFFLGSGHDDVIQGNTIYGGPTDCIYLSYIQNLSLSGNTGGGCTGYVVHVVNTGTNVTIQGNTFSGAENGMFLQDAMGTTVRGNTLAGIGIRLAGTYLSAYDGLTITPDNLVSGKPVLYSKDCGSVTYGKTTKAGEILAANCTSLSVSNLTFAVGSVAVQAAFVGSVTLYQDTIDNQNDSGFLLWNVARATVAGCSFTGDWYGENATGTGNLSVVNSTFAWLGDGLAVNGGAIAFDNATFSGLPYGTNLDGVTGGFIKDSRYVGSAVTVPLPGWGGALNAVSSRGVTIVNSTFAGNVGGITLSGGTTGFRMYHNTFDSNGRDAWDGNPGQNFWNASYPVGGNIWTLYHGWDDCHGPLQNNCTAGDEIGDVPYNVGIDGFIDYYPLLAVNPPKVPPVALLSADVTNVTRGSTVTFTSSSYDPMGWPLLIETLDFGDGTNFSGIFGSFPHTFMAAGNFTVKLTVESLRHLTNTTSLVVSVVVPPPPQPLALVDYVSWRGYVCPVPAAWTRTYNLTTGGNTYELFLQGSVGGLSANMIVDTESVTGVQETAAFLDASVNATLSSVQAKLPDAYLAGPVQILSVPGGLAARFTIAYSSHPILQDGLLVVNRTDQRAWTAILTWPSAAPEQLNMTFDAIVAGFRITSAPVPPASGTSPGPNTGPPPEIWTAAQVLGVVLVVALGVVAVAVILRRRRAPMASPPAYATCPTCGGPLEPGASFCGNCGTRVGGGPPPPGP